MQITARTVDHASSPDHSISQQIIDMFETAQVRTVADLSNTQAVDACGYIAADAVAKLREAAWASCTSHCPMAFLGHGCAVAHSPANDRHRAHSCFNND